MRAPFFIVLSVCFTLFGSIDVSKAAEVTATLDRDAVPAGNGALLDIEVKGANATKPEIPKVENLIVQSRGQNQHFQMINGHTTVSVRFQYAVGSTTPGVYQIPPITVVVDGVNLTTEPLTLTVLDAGAPQPPPGTASASPSGNPDSDDTENQFGFLTVELADNKRQHLYVGEIAPVQISAWLPEGAQAQLRSSIQPEAKGFTLHNVSENPQQAQEQRGGKRYTRVTWFGGISATRSGTFPASLSVDMTVAVPDRAGMKAPRRRGGPFDDPFFDSVLNRLPMIEKAVTLKSDDQEMEVRSLPSEGRPDGFSGAVGAFAFDGLEMPSSWKTGEPQQIATRISGSGNFSLVKAPALNPLDSWRSYPGQDEFRAADQLAFEGSKTFRFSAVPRKGGKQEVKLSFSFFDPDKELYQTIFTPPKILEISGADVANDEPAEELIATPPRKQPDMMVGQREIASPAASLKPLVRRSAFVEMLAAAGMMILAGLIMGVLRRRRRDPVRQKQVAFEKSNREASAAVLTARDGSAFFTAARLTLQQRLGMMWNQPPLAITTAEVEARIASDAAVTRFFREADHYEYRSHQTDEISPQWRALFEEALATLKP